MLTVSARLDGVLDDLLGVVRLCLDGKAQAMEEARRVLFKGPLTRRIYELRQAVLALEKQ